MATSSKPRIIKEFHQLPDEVQDFIKYSFPNGFHNQLVEYIDKGKKKKKALPFETDEFYYLVRMSVQEAKGIISDDPDYEDGVMRDEVFDEYEERFEN